MFRGKKIKKKNIVVCRIFQLINKIIIRTIRHAYGYAYVSTVIQTTGDTIPPEQNKIQQLD